jgi:hypothetical protein
MLSCTTIISKPDNLEFLVSCTILVDKINKHQIGFIQAIINEITMLFVIYSHSNSKNNGGVASNQISSPGLR